MQCKCLFLLSSKRLCLGLTNAIIMISQSQSGSFTLCKQLICTYVWFPSLITKGITLCRLFVQNRRDVFINIFPKQINRDFTDM